MAGARAHARPHDTSTLRDSPVACFGAGLALQSPSCSVGDSQGCPLWRSTPHGALARDTGARGGVVAENLARAAPLRTYAGVVVLCRIPVKPSCAVAPDPRRSIAGPLGYAAAAPHPQAARPREVVVSTGSICPPTTLGPVADSRTSWTRMERRLGAARRRRRPGRERDVRFSRRRGGAPRAGAALDADARALRRLARPPVRD